MSRRHRMNYSIRVMLALTAFAALGLALQQRYVRFKHAAEKYRTAHLACWQECFTASKFGQNYPNAVYTAGERYPQAAALHDYAAWRPWVLFSPQYLKGDHLRIEDEENNTTTVISIGR